MKRKKLLYIPGTISLIGLPILLLLIRPENPVNYNTIRIFLPSDKKPPDVMIRFSKYGLYQSLKKKKVTTLYLDGFHAASYSFNDDFLENKKLQFLENEIQRIQFTHDTSSVLKIKLDDNVNYGEFIWLTNLTLLYSIKRWALVDDEFYIFSNPPPQQTESSPLLINDVMFSPPEPNKLPSKWEIYKISFINWWEEFKTSIKRNYVLSIGFVLLIAVPSLISIAMKKKTIQLVKKA